jgi:octaprenyl-diphosphate synthase
MEKKDQYSSSLFVSLVEEPLRQMEQQLREVKTVRFLCDYPWPAGKRLRPITFLLSLLSVRIERSSGASTNGRESRLAAAIELMHEASLVHDDLVDRSVLRRGVPTVQMVNGDGLALLIGDYMVFRGLKLVLDSAENKTDILLAQELANTGLVIAHGEADQLSRFMNHHNLKDRMSFDAYIDLIAKKTASFFAGCAETGAALGGADRALRQIYRDFGMNMGIVFQIKDDLIDVYGDQDVASKTLRNNLSEGTVTLPLIHAWEMYPTNRALRRFVTGKEVDEKDQATIYRKLASKEVRKRCERTMKGYMKKADNCLDQMPMNIYRSGLADLFAYVKQCPWGGFLNDKKRNDK